MARHEQPCHWRTRHLERARSKLGRRRHVPAGYLGLAQQPRRFLEPDRVEIDFDQTDRVVDQRALGRAWRLAEDVFEGVVTRRQPATNLAREIDAFAD